jgi:hypothetical protein
MMVSPIVGHPMCYRQGLRDGYFLIMMLSALVVQQVRLHAGSGDGDLLIMMLSDFVSHPYVTVGV